MSSQDIADLVAVLQGLTVVVSRLANTANQPTTTARRFEEDWEIVEEEYAPGAPSSPHSDPVTVGTNYTQVPQFCYDLAKHRLTGASIGSVARTDRAFFCGIEAKEALRLGTPYTTKRRVLDCNWLIGSSLGPLRSKAPCRVTTKRELNRLQFPFHYRVADLLRRCWYPHPTPGEMEKQSLRWAVDGDPSLLVVEIPPSIGPGDEVYPMPSRSL